VKLGEVGLYDPQAGVGKVKGFDIVVAHAAKLVGKKVKVRIGAVMEGMAFAEPVGANAPEAPITAEAEAERPTRAPRKKKPTGEIEALEAEEVEEVEDVEEADEVDEVEDDGPEDGEEAPAATPKKKTRRGTRGGRNRKKKTAAAPSPEADGAGPEGHAEPEPEREEQPEPADDALPAPVIHVPDRDLGSEEASENGDQPGAARKKTRRGSRGGRNRKKKTGAATSPAPEQNGDEAAEPPAEREGDWDYTPVAWDEVSAE
jgi:predicted RNA-binding protein with TRAM domain